MSILLTMSVVSYHAYAMSTICEKQTDYSNPSRRPRTPRANDSSLHDLFIQENS